MVSFKSTMENGFYHPYADFPKPEEFTDEVWKQALRNEFEAAHSYDESPSFEFAVKIAHSIVNERKEKAEKKKALIEKLSKEISILEYAHLQLANGYGNVVPIEDLIPIRNIIVEKQKSLRNISK